MIRIDPVDRTITVDGVVISMDLLKTLAKADATKLYRFTSVGGVVNVETVQCS